MRTDNTNAYAASCYSHTDADTFSYAYCYDGTITDAYALDTGIAYAYADTCAQGDT